VADEAIDSSWATQDDDLTVLGHQMWVLNRLFNGRPLVEVLGRIVELVEQMRPDGHACVMLMDTEGSALEPTFAPNLPAAVVDALAELPIGPDSPAGGASAQFATPQYTADVRTTRTWGAVGDALVEQGYLACWSTPIISTSQERVLGSIDLYRREPGEPVVADTRVMIMAVRLAALAIDQEAHEWELRHAATHDPLTALPNRTLFAERLDQAAPDGNLAVLFLDLDRFKLVNDTLGHDFGDDLLRAVADRLAEAVVEPSLVSRFGGDEFTVLMPKVEHIDDAVIEAERLLAVVSEPYAIRGQTVRIGASAGVAVAVGADGDPSALVRNADAALYRAKELGRGRVKAFDDRILAVAAQRVHVERSLRDALDAGRIEVMFQPSIHIADGSVVGVEALARCATATGDLISPQRFIPVAEECGLISQVFEQVLAESCRVAKVWNAGRTRPIVVWVNLSPSQLGSIDVVAQVRRAFERSGVDPTTIGFEVTEQGVLTDPAEARNRLSALVALGSHAALDDFGTGHSSLSHLQDLPVDTVKLDRSFVIRAIEDIRSRAIVGGVVQLAEAIGLHCVAEGVETPAHLDAVRELGCDTVQGNIYSRPRRAADLGIWLAHRPPGD
jgi:diguanylate cyclase (GGDEF)-like protein